MRKNNKKNQTENFDDLYNKKHYTKTEKQILICRQNGQPFDKKDWKRLQLWQRMYNIKAKRELKWASNGDQAHYIMMKQRHKRIVYYSTFLTIYLAIFALSVCGIVFASIDFSKGIFNGKSICFMVFGCLGMCLMLVPGIINIIRKIIRTSRRRKYSKAEEVLIDYLKTDKRMNLKVIEKLSRMSKIPAKDLMKVYSELDEEYVKEEA